MLLVTKAVQMVAVTPRLALKLAAATATATATEGREQLVPVRLARVVPQRWQQKGKQDAQGA